MIAKILVVASVISVINLTNVSSVSFITRCKSNDPECAKANAVNAIPLFAAGLPEYGVETMDPIYFHTVDSSSPNLKFILNDISITGLKGCKPNKVQRDTEKSNIFLQFECALTLDGQYELAGEVILLNISGKGKVHALLRKLVLDVVMDTEEKEGKDGEKYFRIKKFKHSYELKDKSDVIFEGLLENNAVLQKAAEELIKNNGNDIVKEIGGEMFLTCITKVVENLNRFFEKVPIKELSSD